MSKRSRRGAGEPPDYLESRTAIRLLERASLGLRQRRPPRIRKPADRRDLAIGFSIRRRAEAMGISVGALAYHFGVSHTLMEDYLQGYQPIGFSLLVKFAHRFDCRVADLIGDIDGGVGDGAAQESFRTDARHLRVEGAQSLLEAYTAAPPGMRKAIVALATALANERTERGAR